MSDTRACYEHWADADISFLAKGKDRFVCTLHFALLHFVSLFGIISQPPNPISAKNAIHFTAAYVLDCLLLSSNLSSKHLSNDSLQRHLKDTLRKA